MSQGNRISAVCAGRNFLDNAESDNVRRVARIVDPSKRRKNVCGRYLPSHLWELFQMICTGERRSDSPASARKRRETIDHVTRFIHDAADDFTRR
jgi:hypothetical protein